MKESSKPWIDAAVELSSNQDSPIHCPECKTGILTLKEEIVSEDTKKHYITCNSCGRWNVLTLVTVTIIEEEDPFDEKPPFDKDD